MMNTPTLPREQAATSVFLFLAAPIITLIFSLGEFFGWWDCLSGRKKAIEGFDRLRFAHGFPKGFVYDDDQDREIFDALVKCISKNTRDEALRKMLDKGKRPSVIVVIGQPQPIIGIPTDWEQPARFFYPSEQPIMMGFNWARSNAESIDGNQSATVCRVGTISDLREWIDKEKEQRKFWIGTVVVSFISLYIRWLSSTSS
jgi:hypothetical protein